MHVQHQSNDLEEYCTLFSFALVFSHWVFLSKVFNEAIVIEWWSSKGECYEIGIVGGCPHKMSQGQNLILIRFSQLGGYFAYKQTSSLCICIHIEIIEKRSTFSLTFSINFSLFLTKTKKRNLYIKLNKTQSSTWMEDVYQPITWEM